MTRVKWEHFVSEHTAKEVVVDRSSGVKGNRHIITIALLFLYALPVCSHDRVKSTLDNTENALDFY